MTPPTTAPSPPASAQPRYSRLANPSHDELRYAAYRWHKVALWAHLEYAIVGGFAAVLHGSMRRTKSLDILLPPLPHGNGLRLQPLIDGLFDANPMILNYSRGNREGHVVVTAEGVGVTVNFIKCANNVLDFPEIIQPQNQDARREVTISNIVIQTPQTEGPIAVPVLLPRLLLQQRLFHFQREGDDDDLLRKQNDVSDIIAFLNALQTARDQSYTDEEAATLVPKVRDLLTFAELYWLQDATDVEKWLYINIPLREGDWRRRRRG
jgi:hypothetical protein